MTHESLDDLPAGVASRTVDSEGVIEYWDAENRLHNPDGPARITPDRSTFWLVTGRDPGGVHNLWFGQHWWFRHGRRHRTDGPAAMHGNGYIAYYLDGVFLTEAQFHQHNTASHAASATDYRA